MLLIDPSIKTMVWLTTMPEMLRDPLGPIWNTAGGYGLYLKQLHMAQAGVRTLIDANLWPTPRALGFLASFFT